MGCWCASAGAVVHPEGLHGAPPVHPDPPQHRRGAALCKHHGGRRSALGPSSPPIPPAGTARSHCLPLVYFVSYVCCVRCLKCVLCVLCGVGVAGCSMDVPSSHMVLPVRWPSLRPPLRPHQYASIAVSTHLALMSYAGLADWCLFLLSAFRLALFGATATPRTSCSCPPTMTLSLWGGIPSPSVGKGSSPRHASGNRSKAITPELGSLLVRARGETQVPGALPVPAPAVPQLELVGRGPLRVRQQLLDTVQDALLPLP